MAKDDQATAEPGKAVVIDVLKNDGAPTSGILHIVSVTDPQKGRVSYSRYSIMYLAAPDATGIDTFNYTVQYPSGTTATATVTVNIVSTGQTASSTKSSATEKLGWPTLRVKALSPTASGEWVAIIDGIAGVVETGQLIEMNKDGVTYRWKIAEVSSNGVSYTQFDTLGSTRTR